MSKTITVTFTVPDDGARDLYHELKEFGQFGIAVDGSDPHVTAELVSISEGNLTERVQRLWTDENGWIPGAARQRLADVLDLHLPKSQDLEACYSRIRFHYVAKGSTNAKGLCVECAPKDEL